MVATRAPAVRAALVAALRAQPALTDIVYDGPIITGDPSDGVFVGYDGDPGGDLEAVTVQTGWAGTVGAKKRDEQITIVCSVVVLQGESDVDAVTVAAARAYTLLDAIDTAIFADPSLGQPPPVGPAHISSHQLFTEPEQGVLARLVFHVSMATRI